MWSSWGGVPVLPGYLPNQCYLSILRTDLGGGNSLISICYTLESAARLFAHSKKAQRNRSVFTNQPPRCAIAGVRWNCCTTTESFLVLFWRLSYFSNSKYRATLKNVKIVGPS